MRRKSTWRFECDELEWLAALWWAAELYSKLSVAEQARVEGTVYVRNLHARTVMEKRCAR